MADRIRVHGLRETAAAFRKVDSDLSKRLFDDLLKAAEPVVQSARGKVTRYPGGKSSSIRAKKVGNRVLVEQTARKVTGLRGDFGSLQMRTVLLPARAENTGKVFEEVTRALDKYGLEAGF